jgi:hypothetical protein
LEPNRISMLKPIGGRSAAWRVVYGFLVGFRSFVLTAVFATSASFWSAVKRVPFSFCAVAM